jgi:hypothetical protein
MVAKVFREIEEDVTAKGKQGNLYPPQRRLPLRIRKHHSIYHFLWGRTLLEENYKGLWKDALVMSVSYNPFNMRAWYYYIVGFSPSFMRSVLIKLYKAVENSLGRLYYGLTSSLSLRR